MRTSSEIMTEARASLNGKWGNMVLVTILLILIMGAAGFTYVGSLLLTGPLTFGYYLTMCDNLEGRQFDFARLFKGFDNFVNTFLLGLLVSLFTFLWSLLLVIPGIIAAIRYSMAFLIMKDNPQLTAMQAIDQSCIMMEGHKMEFFMLCLNFIGWFILSIITCGVGFIFLYPYIYTSIVLFYEDLKKEQTPAF